ncbi:MAG TPA: iron chelate uptake ABC transporter family permease subunit [Bacteroidota bacterium]|nr:iron chelate uptake ABC transporter family permease subunit [Bacteroidota bacterium]
MEQVFYLPSSMFWPLAACLVLTGIHVYLGVHVIARKVIFVDLALAQIAALGTVIGVLLGYEVGKDTTALYLYSLAFTIFGAFIFSITKMKTEKVPHEAIIGIVYAVTFASTMLVISRSPLGPQELDHIIKGELLWVQGPTVIKTALIYAAVGIFHFLFRKKFMAISSDPVKAEQEGTNVRLWDFLFYMSFGFVITSSVAIAGVFLVFSYLVIPSVSAMLLSDKLGTRLAIGWIGGSLCSLIGVKLSWDTGLPTSPLVVCVLAAALLASGLYYFVKTTESKTIVIRNVLTSAGVVGLFIIGVLLFRKGEEDPLEHNLHLLESQLTTDRVTAIANLKLFPQEREQWVPLLVERLRDQDAEVRRASISVLAEMGDTSFLPLVPALIKDESDAVRQAAVSAVRIIGAGTTSPELLKAAENEEDPEIRLSLLRTAVELGNVKGLVDLGRVVEEGGIFADEAFDALKGHLELSFRKDETKELVTWIAQHESELTWNPTTQTFTVKSGSWRAKAHF